MGMHRRYGWIDPAQPVNRLYPLSRGRVGLWIASDQGPCGYGTNLWRDINGLHKHGTLNGPAWSGDAPPGGFGSLSFDGNDYVIADPFVPLVSTNTYVVAFWMRTTSAGASFDFIPFQWGSAGAGEAFGMWLNTGGTLPIFTVGGNTSALASRAVNDGVWHHLIAVFEQGNNRAAVYIDGLLDHENTSYTDDSAIASSVFQIGGRGSLLGFVGDLADFQCFDLGAARFDHAAALYHESLAGYPNTIRRVDWPLFAPAAAGGGGTIPRTLSSIESVYGPVVGQSIVEVA